MGKLFSTVCALLVCLITLMPASALAVYEVEAGLMDLTQPGWDGGVAYEINEGGDVVGYYSSGGVSKAFHYQAGTFTDIMPAGWTASELRSINANGDMVGSGMDTVTKGFLYAGGTFTTYNPAGWTDFKPTRISDNGLIVGNGNHGATDKAFLIDGGVIPLPLPAGFTDAFASDVNNAGTVVGYGTLGSAERGFIYDGFTAYEITPPGWTTSRVTAVNDAGVLLGYGRDGAVIKCFLFDSGTWEVFFEPSWAATICNDFNDQMDILGWGITAGLVYKGFVRRGGEIYAFDGDGQYLITPVSINNALNFAGAGQASGAIVPFMGDLPPYAAITANGEDGLIAVDSTKALKLQVMMSPLGMAGAKGDWWLIGQTPNGPVSYDRASGSWVPGTTAVAGVKLKRLKTTKVYVPKGRAPGVYTYIFGVDLNANGEIDSNDFFYGDVMVLGK